jgi:hypothetical protein
MSTLDPCLGTGRMLLHASNYSLRLYGQDINETCVKASLVNGYLYAPWMVKPFPFLDRDLVDPSQSKAISDAMVRAVDLQDVAAYLENTEHDTENQWRFEPVKKRRKKRPAEECTLQGLLF